LPGGANVPSWEGTLAAFGASWHTIEPSVCCDDAALYQITLTTCCILNLMNSVCGKHNFVINRQIDARSSVENGVLFSARRKHARRVSTDCRSPSIAVLRLSAERQRGGQRRAQDWRFPSGSLYLQNFTFRLSLDPTLMGLYNNFRLQSSDL